MRGCVVVRHRFRLTRGSWVLFSSAWRTRAERATAGSGRPRGSLCPLTSLSEGVRWVLLRESPANVAL